MKYALSHIFVKCATLGLVVVLAGAGCERVAVPTDGQSDAASGGRLELRNRGLEKLPAYVLDMISLKELDISGNRIGGALPSEIGRLKNLEVLDASDNLMTGVPAEIGHLPKLRVLDLSGNKLTGLPMELGELDKLETLDISGNQYSEYDLKLIRERIPGANIITE